MSDQDGSVPPAPDPAGRTWPALDIDGLPLADDALAVADSALPSPGDSDTRERVPDVDPPWPPASAERDLLEAALIDFEVSAVHETSFTSWRVFFATPAERDAAASALARDFAALAFTVVDVVDDDWAARSQASLTPIRVGRIIVAPPWCVDQARELGTDLLDQRESRPIILVIQPSMGFGTGHHATTRLCLAALQQIPLEGHTVIDVGTGSGVLAIAASLLGASAVIGVDDDADAIHAARENLHLNRDARVALETGDVRVSAPAPADVVVANLTGGLLVSAALRLQRLVAPHGTLILSGLMEQEEGDVVAAFNCCGTVRRDQEDEWLCLTLSGRS